MKDALILALLLFILVFFGTLIGYTAARLAIYVADVFLGVII